MTPRIHFINILLSSLLLILSLLQINKSSLLISAQRIIDCSTIPEFSSSTELYNITLAEDDSKVQPTGSPSFSTPIFTPAQPNVIIQNCFKLLQLEILAFPSSSTYQKSLTIKNSNINLIQIKPDAHEWNENVPLMDIRKLDITIEGCEVNMMYVEYTHFFDSSLILRESTFSFSKANTGDYSSNIPELQHGLNVIKTSRSNAHGSTRDDNFLQGLLTNDVARWGSTYDPVYRDGFQEYSVVYLNGYFSGACSLRVEKSIFLDNEFTRDEGMLWVGLKFGRYGVRAGRTFGEALIFDSAAPNFENNGLFILENEFIYNTVVGAVVSYVQFLAPSPYYAGLNYANRVHDDSTERRFNNPQYLFDGAKPMIPFPDAVVNRQLSKLHYFDNNHTITKWNPYNASGGDGANRGAFRTLITRFIIDGWSCGSLNRPASVFKELLVKRNFYNVTHNRSMQWEKFVSGEYKRKPDNMDFARAMFLIHVVRFYVEFLQELSISENKFQVQNVPDDKESIDSTTLYYSEMDLHGIKFATFDFGASNVKVLNFSSNTFDFTKYFSRMIRLIRIEPEVTMKFIGSFHVNNNYARYGFTDSFEGFVMVVTFGSLWYCDRVEVNHNDAATIYTDSRLIPEFIKFGLTTIHIPGDAILASFTFTTSGFANLRRTPGDWPNPYDISGKTATKYLKYAEVRANRGSFSSGRRGRCFELGTFGEFLGDHVIEDNACEVTVVPVPSDLYLNPPEGPFTSADEAQEAQPTAVSGLRLYLNRNNSNGILSVRNNSISMRMLDDAFLTQVFACYYFVSDVEVYSSYNNAGVYSVENNFCVMRRARCGGVEGLFGGLMLMEPETISRNRTILLKNNHFDLEFSQCTYHSCGGILILARQWEDFGTTDVAGLRIDNNNITMTGPFSLRGIGVTSLNLASVPVADFSNPTYPSALLTGYSTISMDRLEITRNNLVMKTTKDSAHFGILLACVDLRIPYNTFAIDDARSGLWIEQNIVNVTMITEKEAVEKYDFNLNFQEVEEQQVTLSGFFSSISLVLSGPRFEFDSPFAPGKVSRISKIKMYSPYSKMDINRIVFNNNSYFLSSSFSSLPLKCIFCFGSRNDIVSDQVFIQSQIIRVHFSNDDGNFGRLSSSDNDPLALVGWPETDGSVQQREKMMLNSIVVENIDTKMSILNINKNQKMKCAILNTISPTFVDQENFDSNDENGVAMMMMKKSNKRLEIRGSETRIDFTECGRGDEENSAHQRQKLVTSTPLKASFASSSSSDETQSKFCFFRNMSFAEFEFVSPSRTSSSPLIAFDCPLENSLMSSSSSSSSAAEIAFDHVNFTVLSGETPLILSSSSNNNINFGHPFFCLRINDEDFLRTEQTDSLDVRAPSSILELGKYKPCTPPTPTRSISESISVIPFCSTFKFIVMKNDQYQNNDDNDDKKQNLLDNTRHTTFDNTLMKKTFELTVTLVAQSEWDPLHSKYAPDDKHRMIPTTQPPLGQEQQLAFTNLVADSKYFTPWPADAPTRERHGFSSFTLIRNADEESNRYAKITKVTPINNRLIKIHFETNDLTLRVGLRSRTESLTLKYQIAQNCFECRFTDDQKIDSSLINQKYSSYYTSLEITFHPSPSVLADSLGISREAKEIITKTTVGVAITGAVVSGALSSSIGGATGAGGGASAMMLRLNRAYNLQQMLECEFSDEEPFSPSENPFNIAFGKEECGYFMRGTMVGYYPVMICVIVPYLIIGGLMFYLRFKTEVGKKRRRLEKEALKKKEKELLKKEVELNPVLKLSPTKRGLSISPSKSKKKSNSSNKPMNENKKTRNIQEQQQNLILQKKQVKQSNFQLFKEELYPLGFPSKLLIPFSIVMEACITCSTVFFIDKNDCYTQFDKALATIFMLQFVISHVWMAHVVWYQLPRHRFVSFKSEKDIEKEKMEASKNKNGEDDDDDDDDGEVRQRVMAVLQDCKECTEYVDKQKEKKKALDRRKSGVILLPERSTTSFRFSPSSVSALASRTEQSDINNNNSNNTEDDEDQDDENDEFRRKIIKRINPKTTLKDWFIKICGLEETCYWEMNENPVNNNNASSSFTTDKSNSNNNNYNFSSSTSTTTDDSSSSLSKLSRHRRKSLRQHQKQQHNTDPKFLDRTGELLCCKKSLAWYPFSEFVIAAICALLTGITPDPESLACGWIQALGIILSVFPFIVCVLYWPYTRPLDNWCGILLNGLIALSALLFAVQITFELEWLELVVETMELGIEAFTVFKSTLDLLMTFFEWYPVALVGYAISKHFFLHILLGSLFLKHKKHHHEKESEKYFEDPDKIDARMLLTNRNENDDDDEEMRSAKYFRNLSVVSRDNDDDENNDDDQDLLSSSSVRRNIKKRRYRRQTNESFERIV